MHPDLFITIAFVSIAVAAALIGLVFAHSERRRQHAAGGGEGGETRH
jgi:hypothetical protein